MENKPKQNYSKIVIIGAVVLVLLGVFYFVHRAGGSSSPTDKQVAARLGTIILLPANVMPTIAVIMDANALRQQQPNFFADAQNGDRLILYPGLAIIYDYSANKIIKIGPIQNVQAQTAATSTSSKKK